MTKVELKTHNLVESCYSGYVTVENGLRNVTLELNEKHRIDTTLLAFSGSLHSAAMLAAISVVNKSNAFVYQSNCQFMAPLQIGDTVIFKGKILKETETKSRVLVEGIFEGLLVFNGTFEIVSSEKNIMKLSLLGVLEKS
jgi:acyl-CoA thioesterase